MKIIRKSSLWERDDLELWIIAVTIAIVAYFYRIVPIFFIQTQGCFLYYDSLALSSPSLLLTFFGIFEALFIWNLVVFLDNVWQKTLSRVHLWIHIFYAFVLMAGVLSSIYFIYFAYQYDSIMSVSDVEWITTNKGKFPLSVNRCLGIQKYLGRWKVSIEKATDDHRGFSLKEIEFMNDNKFKAYNKNLDIAYFGRWRTLNRYSDKEDENCEALWINADNEDLFYEFNVVKCLKDTMILKAEFAFFDSKLKGDLIVHMDKLPSVKSYKSMLDSDWSFIFDRDKEKIEGTYMDTSL